MKSARATLSVLQISMTPSLLCPLLSANPTFISLFVSRPLLSTAHFTFQSCPTLWTEARQAPLSLGFSSKNAAVNCHAPLRYIPDQGIKPMSLKTLALADGFFTTSTSWEAQVLHFTNSPGMDVLSSLVFKYGCRIFF